jgi:hypothetical protein
MAILSVGERQAAKFKTQLGAAFMKAMAAPIGHSHFL